MSELPLSVLARLTFQKKFKPINWKAKPCVRKKAFQSFKTQLEDGALVSELNSSSCAKSHHLRQPFVS